MRKGTIDAEKFKSLYEKGMNDSEIAKELNVSDSQATRFRIKLNLPGLPMSDAVRAKISEKRKEWLAKNSDKHPWKNNDKFKSVPCEKLKGFLKTNGVEFIEEYDPKIKGRHFSIDIALPDKMIAIEVNGNQHYEKGGSLKPYYLERHRLLEKNGWTIYQVHYSACFNLEKWSEFLYEIRESRQKVEFDYFDYIPRRKKIHKDVCSKCENAKLSTSKLCKNCSIAYRKANGKSGSLVRARSENSSLEEMCDIHFTTRPKEDNCPKCGEKKKVKSKLCYSCHFPCLWPTPEEISKLIWEIPCQILAKKLGVSDKAVEKFCKKHGLSKPPRGYWAKKQAKE